MVEEVAKRVRQQKPLCKEETKKVEGHKGVKYMEAEYEWLNALRQSRRCGAEKKQHKLREEQAEGSSKSQQP